MKNAIDAVYENGAFRPLQPESVVVPNGQIVRLTIEDETEPEQLRLAAQVYEGLSASEIDEIEHIALDRSNFFGSRNAK
jgi:predicted DNA-binding antitoxin AbrB/MazE fold protein